MKKNILSLIGIGIIVTTINLQVGLNKKKTISDLTLSNIEALASPIENENGSGGGGGEKLYSYPCSHGGGQQCIRPNGLTGPSCSPLSYC